MKTVAAVLLLVSITYGSAIGHPAGDPKPVCEEIALDAVGGVDITGQPRSAPDQIVYRMVTSDRGDSLGLYTYNDAQEPMWALMRDLLCGEIELVEKPEPQPSPASTPCTPRQVWYGCNPGINGQAR